MKRISFALLLVFLLSAVTLSISTTVFALTGETRPAQQSSLPQITYLGQGPQTFTIEPPLKFLVKTYQNGVFLFVMDDGPTYEARANERVWTTNFLPSDSIRMFHESRSYGFVEAGCVVNYVQIEDNLDQRRNTFYINGNPLQVVEQGMVTYGSFTVPEAGELTFYAEDSIGMVIELCQNIQTVVPSETPTGTGTVTTPTEEVGMPSPTATLTATVQTPSATFPPTEVIIINPSETPTLLIPTLTSTVPASTQTQPPAATPVTATVTSPPAATSTVQPQTILITATPIATPLAIPVTGGLPGLREIAGISLVIFGLFALILTAWWFLLRAFKHER